MKKYTFDDIREQNLLLYEYVRGSTLYGLNTPDSDVDTAGVFLAPAEQLLGLGLDYQEDISDERHDTTWFEMNKFMKMLLKSNPTVLESLFVPKDKVIGEIHPIMQYLIDNRDMFVTKECFKPFGGYAVEQIRKMRGLNKKIVNPITERLQPLDFAYTFKLQGSTKIKNWLDYRGLKQQYCGLVHIPNMHNTYGVYYDWGNHFLNEGINQYDIENEYMNHDKGETDLYKMARFLKEYTKEDSISNAFAYINTAPIGYRGMVGEDGLSNELRLSSVSKGEVPICHMCYNKDGYTSHCIDYKEYQDWAKFRNPKRYESNLEKNYDSKNCMHSFRLMNMCIEIAKGESVKLDRTSIDREFLMDIRNHKFEYDEIADMIDKKKEEMDLAINQSNIPEKIDVDLVNDLLINIRKKQLLIE